MLRGGAKEGRQASRVRVSLLNQAKAGFGVWISNIFFTEIVIHGGSHAWA